ncbi:aldehyde dehydrogenase family protein [Micromonospora sp. CA-240977]|uniref:aldehyde dehydrogenase family protein n=1 Tax=Micromonospora sp. CA-240977 TaxID=3239957 RepID=UPI003D8A2D87
MSVTATSSRFGERRIGGREVPAASGRTTDDPYPVAGGMYVTDPVAGLADVRAAVDAAQAAFPGWAATEAATRRSLLVGAADLLERHTEALAGILRQETEGSRAWAEFNIRLAAGQLRQGAAMATRPVAGLLATSVNRGVATAIRQPAGVVVSFVPWNGSMVLCARAIAVALAVGNTVLIRPSAAPVTSGLILAEVLAEAGAPTGVVNVVTADRAEASAVVEALITDPRVRRLTFTGSTGFRRVVGRTAGERVRPIVTGSDSGSAVLAPEPAGVGAAR